jgi:hypothetical protein
MTLSTVITDTIDRIRGRGDGEADATTTSETPIESIPVKPTKAEVLDAIMAETGCTRSEAGNVIAWAKKIVGHCRANNYRAYYPTEVEMRGTTYRITDEIIQHGQAATPDSAHALMEGLLLDPTRDETGLLHDNRDESGSPSYCQIQVAIGVIR